MDSARHQVDSAHSRRSWGGITYNHWELNVCGNGTLEINSNR